MPLDEFNVIQQYFVAGNKSTADDGVMLGIGDDTAILKAPSGEELLFTTDTLINGVHFPEYTPPRAIGFKSLAVNLSDIAAMSGKARWFTLALSLPESDPQWLKEFSEGMFELAHKFDVRLVGGDTTRGSLSITISVIGTTEEHRSVRRDTAKEGDSIFITGEPGLASIGLSIPDNEAALSDNDKKRCLDKLNYPLPRLQEGEFVRDFASSMIDVSDGLCADLSHITNASNCGAILFTAALSNILPASFGIATDSALDAILYGGDDYELLLTVPAEKSVELKKSWPASFATLLCIGKISAGKGIFMQDETGNQQELSIAGYNHFHG